MHVLQLRVACVFYTRFKNYNGFCNVEDTKKTHRTQNLESEFK